MNQQLCQTSASSVEPKKAGNGPGQDSAPSWWADPVFELVSKARLGDRNSLDQLAGQVRTRLRTYVYRLTQQEDLAQEIVQESLFEMCKVLGKLKETDRFWPWLYGIAVNKLRHYYRTERTQQKLAISSMQHRSNIKQRQDGLERLVSEELKQIVSSAMANLKTRHKAVLVMRCYDGMKYSEIAESMGCSEFSTRMLFMRAKKSLQKELSRNGLGKGSLLAALVLFGKMTAPSEAAAAQVAVSAAVTKVGLLAGIAGVATTKTAIISVTAASVLTAGTLVATSDSWRQPTGSRGALSPSLATSQDVARFGQSDGAEEYWYYFPQGPQEPMMLRAKAGIVGDKSYSQVLQNDRANYYYHGDSVYINNYRYWAGNLSVLKLPTDNPELTDFICQVEGGKDTMKHVSAPGKGLLVIAARSDTGEGGRRTSDDLWLIRHYNVLDEEYFQGDWPATAKIIDNRDAMHKRGWAYFRVTGQLNGQTVSGTGRIPFVYITSKKYSPWLKMQVGSLTIADTYKEAYLNRAELDRFVTFKGGSFFDGLAKPWMGLHAIDTVRRDAASRRIWFQTRYASGDKFAEVELRGKTGSGIIYRIDMEADVIDEIIFSTDKGSIGNLKFSYLQSVDGAGGLAAGQEFLPPAGLKKSAAVKPAADAATGGLWLMRLVEGSLE